MDTTGTRTTKSVSHFNRLPKHRLQQSHALNISLQSPVLNSAKNLTTTHGIMPVLSSPSKGNQKIPSLGGKAHTQSHMFHQPQNTGDYEMQDGSSRLQTHSKLGGRLRSN